MTAGKLTKGSSAKVVEVIDGDTVVLDDGKEVRLVGIQAPKLPLNRPNFKEWPLAREAKDELEKLVLNQRVTLSYGGARIDRHGRTLAHLHTDDGTWAQGEMLNRGLAGSIPSPTTAPPQRICWRWKPERGRPSGASGR